MFVWNIRGFSVKYISNFQPTKQASYLLTKVLFYYMEGGGSLHQEYFRRQIILLT